MSRYTLLPSNASRCSHEQRPESRNSFERDPEDPEATRKKLSLTDSQRQLVGLLGFIWMFFLYVTLRFMEAQSLGYRPALLATTNILLDTPDLYHDLTLPLLEMVNRTELVTHRCGTRALAPHLLSFLDPDQLLMVQCPPPPNPPSPGEGAAQVNSDEYRQRGACIAKDLFEQQQDHRLPPKSPFTAQPPPTFPSRYLFALLVTNNAATTLPDLLTRVLEAIAILGPENCHLSIVESGTSDSSRQLLDFAAKFLSDHNARGDVESTDTKRRRDDSPPTPEPVKDSLRRIEFTLTKLGADDRSAVEDANAYWNRLRKKALAPLVSSTAPMTPNNSSVSLFDKVVFVQEALTCADDILEMVYQSHLQDADMTCGMTWMSSQHEEPHVVSLKTGQSSRDILGAPLTVPLKSMSTDKDTMHKFQMRHPFQVSCCDWRQGAVVRADILLEQPTTLPDCVGQETGLQLCAQISQWRSSLGSSSTAEPSSPPTDVISGHAIEKHGNNGVGVGVADAGEYQVPRIAIVPQAVWVPGEPEYELLEILDAEGLWSKTDQERRDEVETRLIRASHQRTYGYRKSAAHYEYVARPAVEASSDGDEPKESRAVEVEQQKLQQQQKQDKLVSPTQDAGIMEHGAESRLTRSKVAFGVQDIEQGNAIKAKKEQIALWRPARLCSAK